MKFGIVGVIAFLIDYGLMVALTGLILNDLFMWLFVSVWFIDYRIAKIIVTVLVAIWNFVTRKIFLEKH